MNHTLDLFDTRHREAVEQARAKEDRQAHPLPAARHTDPATSHAAARKAARFAASHSQRILEALKTGAGTVDEIAACIGLQSQQVNKRLPELERMGLAYPTDMLRRSRSGNMERIWKIKEPK